MREYISPNELTQDFADDSAAIQAAIEEAERDGCRCILIPRYNLRRDANEWRIPRSIKIPDHFTVILDNCYMVQETGVYENMFTNSRSGDVEYITKHEQTDITVLGRGNVILDGGKHNRLLEKTKLKNGLPHTMNNSIFFWLNVNGLRVENLRIQNHRYWAMTHLFCCNATIRNVEFYAIPHVYNQDGIDLRIGNHHFTIENITGRTGDDVLALSALGARTPFLRSRFVEGRDHDIHDVRVRNLKADPHFCFIMRLLNQDGCKIYNIDASVLMDASDYATKTRSGACLCAGSPLYFTDHPAENGDLAHLHFAHFTSRSDDCIMLSHSVEDCLIENVKTFGDNVNGIGVWPESSEPCHLKNVTVRHFWYGAAQLERRQSLVLTAEKYHGTAFKLTNMQGELKLEDVHIDRVRTAYEVSGGIHVDVDEAECNESFRYAAVEPDSTLVINGEVVK